MNKKKCWRTFKHSYAVVAVAIGDELCVTGGQKGKLKVFHLFSGQLIKAISAHSAPVTTIKFDRWHILSGSMDGYALLFSTQGKHKKCIMAMRHPKEVLCLEFQYLRAITGSADGKIRIWNVLNGDCIRVMRGNSRCDPILSMSIIDNRILMNTENNIILMEFEAVQYEYGSNRDETTETITLNEERPILYKSTQKQFYSTKRACRMELLQTPNTKLFNDDRKAPMNHSSRPLSTKNLREAHLIHTILSKKENNQLIVNSAGHISESALNKRRSVMQSINAILTSHCSSSVSSAMSYKPATAELSSSLMYSSNEKENQHKKIEIIEELNASSMVKIPTNLDETKQFLRDQLKEIKQASQKQDEINFTKLKQIKDESKSCIDSSSINRFKMSSGTGNDDYTNVVSGMTSSIRVLSARPTFDTKTKIKLKAQDLTNMKLTPTQATSNEDLAKANESSFKKQTTTTPQTLVTKVFESQEADLKSKVKT